MYQIDQSATAKADWKINEVVSEDQILLRDGSHIFIRRFKGITIDGYFIVQDFYKDTDIKLTDPYLLINKDSIETRNNFLIRTFPLPLVSNYYEYYKTGSKSREIELIDDLSLMTIYYPTGEKLAKTPYHFGVRNGNFISWYANGKKENEGQFKDDKRTGVWTTWEADGKLFAKVEYVDDEIVKELPI